MVLFRWFYDKETEASKRTTSDEVLLSLWNDNIGMSIQTYNKRLTLSSKIYSLLDTHNLTLGCWWQVINPSATAEFNQVEVVKVWLASQGGECTFKSLQNAVERKVWYLFLVSFLLLQVSLHTTPNTTSTTARSRDSLPVVCISIRV